MRVSANIDLDALIHNFHIVKQKTKAKIIAMVKGNGYGHGLVRVAKTLSNAEAFGVSDIVEAVELRLAGIRQTIVVMGGFLSTADLVEFSIQQLDSVVHTERQVEQLETVKLPTPVNVWLKINTGMNRLGFAPAETDRIYHRLKHCRSVAKINLMSHLADADSINHPRTIAQIDCFEKIASQYPCEKSLAKSGGILNSAASHFDWVRPGIMLYGISPISNTLGSQYDLRPVMTVQSKLVAIQYCRRGDKIGYNGIWECDENMSIGVVAMGYADGYPRHAKNGTPVLIDNKICPLVGRVSMDFITVDLRPCAHAKIGDSVVLWGKDLPAEEIAQHADTIAYELTTRISPRIVTTSDKKALYNFSS